MADEPSYHNPNSKTASTKNFAVKVFKESSVTAISTILSTSNIPRKVFRILVFSAFAAGFLSQCVTFFSYLLEYPTVLDLNMVRPESYKSPAYTFCNRNKVKRSKFCQKYPENCVVPDENFCNKFPRYCGENRLPMPKLDLTDLQRPEDVIELSHDIDDLYGPIEDVTVTGPLIVSAEDDDEYSLYGCCYSINSRVQSPLDPTMRFKRESWEQEDVEFEFNPEENETFNPGSNSGIVFAIDSPFDPVNPFDKGIIMKPGNFYKIFIRMHEELLLPYPYKTNCLNYTDKWLKDNRRGVRSQKACQELCEQQFMYSCINCSVPVNGFQTDFRRCTTIDVDELALCMVNERKAGIFEKCDMYCKEDCQKMKYLYEVQEIRMTPRWTDNKMDVRPRLIKVKISFEDSEIVSMHYRPQYQDVEAFSYIGGFIGIWLGVSLVQVADILESLFRIARYFFFKRRGTAEKRQDAI